MELVSERWNRALDLAYETVGKAGKGFITTMFDKQKQIVRMKNMSQLFPILLGWLEQDASRRGTWVMRSFLKF